MSDKIEVNGGGMGLSSVLTIIFVLAKLAGFISWSWWLVFAPVLVSFTIGILILVFAMVVAGIAVYLGSK